MVALVGLNSLSRDSLTATICMFLLAAVIVGWATDAIMGSTGNGVIGNTIFSFIGIFVGLATWTYFAGPTTSKQVAFVALSAGGGVVFMLVLVGLLRRVLRLSA